MDVWSTVLFLPWIGSLWPLLGNLIIILTGHCTTWEENLFLILVFSLWNFMHRYHMSSLYSPSISPHTSLEKASQHMPFPSSFPPFYYMCMFLFKSLCPPSATQVHRTVWSPTESKVTDQQSSTQKWLFSRKHQLTMLPQLEVQLQKNQNKTKRKTKTKNKPSWDIYLPLPCRDLVQATTTTVSSHVHQSYHPQGQHYSVPTCNLALKSLLPLSPQSSLSLNAGAGGLSCSICGWALTVV